jgi:hypothetical protein
MRRGLQVLPQPLQNYPFLANLEIDYESFDFNTYTQEGFMKRLLLVFTLGLLVVSSGFAQVADPTTLQMSAAPLNVPGTPSLIPAPPMPNVLAPTPTTIFMAYVDNKTQPYLFRVPTSYNNGEFRSLNIGQRFTLPTTDGFLDSLYIIIRELPLGKIRFDVWQDALRQRVTSDTTKYHYPDYWTGASALIDTTVRLSAGQNDTSNFTKIVYNHKLVPQEFHITVAPVTAGGVTPLFGLLSDSKKGDETTRTPKVARSTMLILYNNQAIPLHMHGFFQDNIGQGLAPDWYMVAFCEVDMPTGGTQTVALPVGPGLDQNYPNPFTTSTGQTVIPFTMATRGFVTLEVCDAIGRVVRRLANEEVNAGSHVRIFDAKGLPAGIYSYRLISGGQQLTRSMLFVK